MSYVLVNRDEVFAEFLIVQVKRVEISGHNDYVFSITDDVRDATEFDDESCVYEFLDILPLGEDRWEVLLKSEVEVED